MINVLYFAVIPKVNTPHYIEKDDRLIPQWAIAVIVIGVGGLLFIIVFGVSVVSVLKLFETSCITCRKSRVVIQVTVT